MKIFFLEYKKKQTKIKVKFGKDKRKKHSNKSFWKIQRIGHLIAKQYGGQNYTSSKNSNVLSILLMHCILVTYLAIQPSITKKYAIQFYFKLNCEKK